MLIFRFLLIKIKKSAEKAGECKVLKHRLFQDIVRYHLQWGK